MKIKLLYIYISISSLLASPTEITANKFEMDNNHNFTKFTGNVKIVQDRDRIYAEVITVNTNKKKVPILYDASQNVRFKIYTNKQFYNGTCNQLIYNPIKNIYKLIGNAKLIEGDNFKILKGEKITFDKNTGTSKVLGSNKPVKFIFGQNSE